MNRNVPDKQSGFVMLAVVLAITVLAAIAFALNNQGASQVNAAAGEVQRDQLRYVAEAGMAHATWQLSQNTSCSGYSDIPKTDFGADSYSATFSTNKDSPVTVTATGSLASGIEHSLINSTVRAYQPAVASVLQLGKTAGKDTLIDSFYPNANWGSYDDLTVRSKPSWVQRPLLEFDLSAIAAGVRIISAKLELQQRIVGTSGVIGVHRVTRSWEEGTGKGTGNADGATWNEYDGASTWAVPGGDFDSTLYGTATITTAKNGGWVAWDIRELVDEWVSGTSPNYGLILVGDGVVDNAEFESREEADPTAAPKLTIVFACECGKICVAAPGAGKNVLLVVGDAIALTVEQADKKALMEGWGHTVTLIETADTQANFDAAAALVDVVYIPELGGTPMSELGGKADDLAVGVITEEARTAIKLGGFVLLPFVDATSINIVDNTHYITETLPIGSVDLSTATQSFWKLGGTLAPDLHVLGDIIGTDPGLAYVDVGETVNDGNPAAGRRVKLPWGSYNFDVNLLTDDALEIMKRAIEWGAIDSSAPYAHWKLDETSGTTAVDSVGGNDATVQNGAVWTAGQVDGGLDFDGIDDSVSAGAPAALEDIFDGGGTLVAWMHPDGWGEGNYGRIADKSSATYPGNGWALELYGANASFLFQTGFSTASGSWTTPNGSVSLDAWQHVAVVHDTSSDANDPVIYIDGVEQAITELDTPSGTLRSDAGINFTIGNHAMSTVRTFNGQLDDVRIYDRMLSTAEIAPLAAKGAPAGPVAHWKLDDGTGLTAVDSVGGHDGTLTNGPTWVAGQIGDALDFPGNDDYVNVPHADMLSLTSMTISLWLKADALNNVYQTMLRKNQQANYQLTTWTDEIVFAFNDDSGMKLFQTTNANLLTNQWHHVVATLDDTTGDINIYVDGTSIYSTTTPYHPLPNTEPLTIGGTPDASTYWPGLLDDIRLYDYAMTATEISDLYTAGTGGGGGGGGGDVTFEELADASLGSDGLSITIPKPAGTAAGDLLIAAVVTDGEQKPAMTAPAGWTLIDHGKTSKQVTMDVFWKIAGVSEPGNYDFSWLKIQQAYGWIMRFTGHNPAAPIHNSQSGGGTSSSPVSPAVNTTIANTMIVRIGGFDDDDISAGDPGLSGHTAITMGSSSTGTGTASGGAGYIYQSATGDSGTSTFSLTSSEEYRAVTIAIAPAP